MKRKKTSKKPCRASPARSEPFGYQDYVNAKRALLSALDGPCFYLLLTGQSGMGKTALLRDIIQGLDKHRYHVVYLTGANLSLVSIVRFLAARLHIGARRSYLETVDVLAEAISGQSSHMVIWLDEADQLDRDTLQELRTLAEHRLADNQILSIVLAGLPVLAATLDDPSLFPLKRRLMYRCVLTGLRREELGPFITHRFGTTTAQRVPVGVQDELFERTQATPALVDKVIQHAIIHNELTESIVRDVLDSHGL